jgi:hypothetical protein
MMFVEISLFVDKIAKHNKIKKKRCRNSFSIWLTIRDRPFNLKGRWGLWFFVSFINFFSDNTRVRIFISFVAQSANFFPRN